MRGGQLIWDKWDNTRFLFYCGGAWRITGSQWRAAFLLQGPGEPTHCGAFISSAPTDTYFTTYHWWAADWSANNGAHSTFGQPCDEGKPGGWTTWDPTGDPTSRDGTPGGVYCLHSLSLKDNVDKDGRMAGACSGNLCSLATQA